MAAATVPLSAQTKILGQHFGLKSKETFIFSAGGAAPAGKSINAAIKLKQSLFIPVVKLSEFGPALKEGVTSNDFISHKSPPGTEVP